MCNLENERPSKPEGEEAGNGVVCWRWGSMGAWVQGRSQVHVFLQRSCRPRGILKFHSLPLTLRFTLSLSLIHNLFDTGNHPNISACNPHGHTMDLTLFEPFRENYLARDEITSLLIRNLLNLHHITWHFHPNLDVPIMHFTCNLWGYYIVLELFKNITKQTSL